MIKINADVQDVAAATSNCRRLVFKIKVGKKIYNILECFPDGTEVQLNVVAVQSQAIYRAYGQLGKDAAAILAQLL